MTKFRWHRGSLAESMETVVEVAGVEELLDVLRAELARWRDFIPTGRDDITIEPQGFDERIGWDTHLVCVFGKAVGMTDGPL